MKELNFNATGRNRNNKEFWNLVQAAAAAYVSD